MRAPTVAALLVALQLAGCSDAGGTPGGVPGIGLDYQNNSNQALRLWVNIANVGGVGDEPMPPRSGVGGAFPPCANPIGDETDEILWMRVEFRYPPPVSQERGGLYFLGNYTGVKCRHQYQIDVTPEGTVEVYEEIFYQKRSHWWSIHERNYYKRGADLERIPP